MTDTVVNNAQQVIVESITCPITGDVMTDPVQGNDGFNYERSAITEWLTNQKQNSPMTREPMSISDLKPNPNIRYLCDQYHAGKFGVIKRQKSRILEQVDYSIDCNLNYDPDNNNVLFSFLPSNNNISIENTPNVDLVLVLDRSGSTSGIVTTQNSSGDQIEHGFTINDILNHAAKTVTMSLRKNDRVCVIAFDDYIEVVCELILMNNINKNLVVEKINKIKPGGTTNLYGGILQAINILNDREDKTRLTAIMALTDGQPNIRPGRGEVETLARLKKKINFSTPIYTMGFGYNLERGLLYNMAKVTNAGTGHIPDGGMIATVFSNFLAMILTTACCNLQLTIKTPKNELLDDSCIMGDFQYEINNKDDYNEIVVDVGTIQFQQSKDLLIKIKNDFEYKYSYKIGGKVIVSKDYKVNTSSSLPINKTEISYQEIRLIISTNLRKAIQAKKTESEEAYKLYNSSLDLIKTCNHPNISKLENTFKDQVYLAFASKQPEHSQYFHKWGEFYLDQLSSALLRQFQPNFKDDACKPFAGEIYNQFVDHIADTFDNLPPPVPSGINRVNQYRSLGSNPPPATPVNMSIYNDPRGGCWTGDSLVLMADGTQKIASQIIPGDLISTVTLDKDEKINGKNKMTFTKVLGVVKTNYKNKPINLVKLPNNGLITPWHPIWSSKSNNWVFPIEEYPNKVLIQSENQKDNILYNIVCGESHVIIINGIHCITLGHGYKNGILDHPYFGTKEVINDLVILNRDKSNYLTIYPEWFVREGPYLNGSSVKSISKITPDNIRKSSEEMIRSMVSINV